jgi:hypothetical protein
MMRAVLIVALGVLALIGAVVELSCIAGERVATPPPSLFTDALEPGLPSAPEIEDPAGAAGPILTY